MEEPQNAEEAVESVVKRVPVAEVEIVDDRDPGDPDSDDTGSTEETPRESGEALVAALEELREAEQRADTEHQAYLRAVADLDNYRKRMRREQEAVASRASGRVLTSLLPVLDSFDAALGLEVSSEEEGKVLSGLQATHELLVGTLQGQGLEIVPTDGRRFSPDLHQPINAPPEGDGEIMVSGEVRRGYRLGGRLLRAALVTVTRENESE